MKAIRLGTARAEAGKKSWGQLAFRQNGKTVDLPVVVINGKKPGKHAVLIANQHGDEVNGVAVLRRFCIEADPGQVSGTIFAVPSANPNAAIRGTACWNEKKNADKGAYRSEYNMNWIWPGRTGGLLVERAAHELWTKAIMAPHAKAGFVLDLHCYLFREPAVNVDELNNLDLAVSSGIRNVIITRSSHVRRSEPPEINPLSYACSEAGIPHLTVELAGQKRIMPTAVEDGLRACFNLVKFAGFLSGSLKLPGESVIIDPWKEQFKGSRFLGRKRRAASGKRSYIYYSARKDGLYIPHREYYRVVKKGDMVGEVIDPFKGRPVQTIRAGMDGVVYSEPEQAAVSAGEKIVCVATGNSINPASYIRGKRRLRH